jgi:hypothetical protein
MISKLLYYLLHNMFNLFKSKSKAIVEPVLAEPTLAESILTESTLVAEDDGWNLVTNDKPSKVVLAAVDSYDCGWVMDTVWWYEDKQCWMTTGSVSPKRAHMEYTHWRKLPEPPKE